MASVDIQDVRKFYGGTQVLHGVDIGINDGEFVVLVGPSGCGKSTLLRMIAGLEEISSGDVRIDGRVVNDMPPKQRDLAMVFQSYALYPHMTVAENMGFSMRLAKVAKPRIAEEVGRAASILGLTDYLDRYPRHLSGGQRQRVAMGRAIVRNPKVFLFDEPLSNLDAKLRGQMRTEIKSLHNRLAATTIYVTHDQTEAMTMADRIVVMKDGHVEQVGSPMELYNNPRNMFVAGFIGTPPMNFLSGEIKGDVIVFKDQIVPLPHTVARGSGRWVQIGIRPKHLTIAEGAGRSSYPFTVDLVEPTGDEMEVKGSLFGQAITVVLPTTPLSRGETVDLEIRPDALFVFDSATGERL